MRGIRRRALVLSLLTLGLAVTAAQASTYTADPPVQASVTNVYAGCPPDGAGINFPNSEVEPWLDVNPTDVDNLLAIYQQDRYSNGGAKSNAAAASFDGGLTWTNVAIPSNTRCTDGGDYQRASDPWVTFGPTGVAHGMSLVTDPDNPAGGFGDNGMVYHRSFDGGLTWDAAKMLIEETNPRYLNDKNSMTADPNDEDFVYAVWDRLQQAGGDVQSPENRPGLGFKGPIMFARTTNGGNSWEPARRIYETGGNKQTIGNQIVVEPDTLGGSLFDFFSDVTNGSNRRQTIGPVGLSHIRSDNHGTTWTKPRLVASQLPMSLFRADSVIDTEPGVACPDAPKTGACPIRAGDVIPEVAINRSNGNLYAVWMDARFSSFRHDSIAFSQSTNGGNSWSPAIQVNQTPATEPNDDQQAFTPSVHVLDDGTVVVSYFDFRNNTASNATLDTDHWAVHCHPATENCTSAGAWSGAGDETRVTPTSFNIRTAPFARGYFVGDYMGLASDPSGDILSLFGSTAGSGPSSIFLGRLSP
jgi:hypothetical protein